MEDFIFSKKNALFNFPSSLAPASEIKTQLPTDVHQLSIHSPVRRLVVYPRRTPHRTLPSRGMADAALPVNGAGTTPADGAGLRAASGGLGHVSEQSAQVRATPSLHLA